MASFPTANQWKLLLAGVLLVGAGLLVFRQVGGSRRLPNRVRFVCVATGKTYWIDREKLASLPIPAQNPKTGEMTLLPCFEQDGIVYVSSRYQGSLAELGEKNRHVDPETLAVRTSP
jgi:hypothetical protein